MPFAALCRLDPLVVLGIDPGTHTLGYGVVGRRRRELLEVDHGVFRPPAQGAIERRLVFLREALERLLDHHRPHVVSLEEAFVRINAQAALRLGEARGVVLLLAAERSIPVIQYPTARAKKAVCGHGAATKSDVQALVARHLRLARPPEPHDAADALALALCLLFDPRLDPRLAEGDPESSRSRTREARLKEESSPDR